MVRLLPHQEGDKQPNKMIVEICGEEGREWGCNSTFMAAFAT